MRKVKVTIEKAGCNYSAFLPEYDGITGTGKTPELALQSIKEAMEILEELHITFGDEYPEELLDDIEFVVKIKE